MIRTAATGAAPIAGITVIPSGLSVLPVNHLPASAFGLGSAGFAVLPQVSHGLIPMTLAQSPTLPLAAANLVAAQTLTAVQPRAALSANPSAIGIAARTQSLEVGRFASRIAPEMKSIQQGATGASAKTAADRIFNPSARSGAAISEGSEVPAVPSAMITPKAAGLTKSNGARTTPLLSDVTYKAEVSVAHQLLLRETLTRRKAGWIRELARMGVQLAGPVAPVLTITASKDLPKSGKVEFMVEWNQGEMHVGSFKALITLKNLNPELRRLAAPPVPEEKQLAVRFKKTIIANVGGLNVETAVTDDRIAEFLEANGLRLLNKGWGDYEYRVSVTGGAQAAAMAKLLSGSDLVLYARPAALKVPEERQLEVVFKKTTVVDFNGLRVETAVSPDDITALLLKNGLTVLELSRDGVWKVGTEAGIAAEVSDALESAGITLYALPRKQDLPEDRQAVIKFQKSVIVDAGGILVEAAVSEDDVAAFLRGNGLKVAAAYGDGAYKVAGPAGTDSQGLAETLGKDRTVKSAVAVGSLTDQQIEASAKGVASYKGRPWSSTEYNMNYSMSYSYLEMAGATQAQLQKFSDLCDAAPVRGGGFNPWSGD